MTDKDYPVSLDKVIRCKVTNIMENKIPEKNNATLISGCGLGGYVLLDEGIKVKFYNWGWITFDKGAAKP